MDDRYSYGYDAGNIIDGVVRQDPDTKMCTIVDEDGEEFVPQAVLETLIGKKVRMTMISFEALENMEKIYEAAVEKAD
jgi:hypothetical protein